MNREALSGLLGEIDASANCGLRKTSTSEITTLGRRALRSIESILGAPSVPGSAPIAPVRSALKRTG